VVPKKQNLIDGNDITEILKGNQPEHAPVFSMHNSDIMSVRKGDYKLFVKEPPYWKETDLSTWKDKRAPDGTTIIAPIEGQANPGMYPGIKPMKPEHEIQLFNLRNDPTESNDLANDKPDVVKQLMNEYEKFVASIESCK
jgi:hypothetical protein